MFVRKSNAMDPSETLAALPPASDISSLAYTQASNMGATEYLSRALVKIRSEDSMARIMANGAQTAEAVQALIVGASFITKLGQQLTPDGVDAPTMNDPEYLIELNNILEALDGWQGELRNLCIAMETLLTIGAGTQPRSVADLQGEIDAITAVFANKFRIAVNGVPLPDTGSESGDAVVPS